MSLTDKPVKTSYKDVLQIDNSNSGFDSTVRQVKSSDGSGSSIYVSQRTVKIQGNSDASTTLDVQDADGNTKLLGDTTNDYVKALGLHVNTQYVYFGAVSTESIWAGNTNNTHYMIPFQSNSSSALVPIGTGLQPDTSFSISATGDDIVNCMWYVLDNIIIDRVVWWSGADSGTADTTRAHLVSFDVVNDNSSTSGNLSNGVVVCDGADVVNNGNEDSHYRLMTIQSPNIDAGKAVFFTFRKDGTNSDYSLRATIKFHLR